MWENPGMIKKDYPSVGYLPGNRLLFNIKGNQYRLVAGIKHDYGIVWIWIICTHTHHDKSDIENHQDSDYGASKKTQ